MSHVTGTNCLRINEAVDQLDIGNGYESAVPAAVDVAQVAFVMKLGA